MNITRRKTGITDKQIENIVSLRNLNVRRIKRAKWEGMGDVFFIKTEEAELVLKVSLYKWPSFTGECWALEECAKKGIPVPKLLTSGMIQAKLPYPSPYILISRILGNPLQSPSHSLEFHSTEIAHLREAGYLLSKIHSIKTKNFGRLQANGEGIFESWKDFLFRPIFGRKLLNYLFFGMVSLKKRLARDIDSFLELESPVLLHGDFKWHHIFADKGKISGVIDFESCISGDPLYDLADFELKYDIWGYPSPLPYLLEGYKNELTKGDLERKIVFYKLHKALALIWRRVKNGKNIKTTYKLLTLSKGYLQYLGY